jgi:DNA topoisomerase-1
VTEAKRNINTVMRLVSAELGNTPTICRKSYVHPVVLERYIEEGSTIADHSGSSRARRADGSHTPEERALVSFHDEHFPERRRSRRDDA